MIKSGKLGVHVKIRTFSEEYRGKKDLERMAALGAHVKVWAFSGGTAAQNSRAAKLQP